MYGGTPQRLRLGRLSPIELMQCPRFLRSAHMKTSEEYSGLNESDSIIRFVRQMPGKRSQRLPIGSGRFFLQPLHKAFDLSSGCMSCGVDHEVGLDFQAQLLFKHGLQLASGD